MAGVSLLTNWKAEDNRLHQTHPPAVTSGLLQAVTLPSIPGVTINLLLPKATTVGRYQNNSQRVLLRTDDHTELDRDHIVCFKDADGRLDCNSRV
jgi:hypothetical protein